MSPYSIPQNIPHTRPTSLLNWPNATRPTTTPAHRYQTMPDRLIARANDLITQAVEAGRIPGAAVAICTREGYREAFKFGSA